MYPWKRTHLAADSFDVVELLVPIFENGELVYNVPSLPEIVSYANEQIKLLWPEYFRLNRPPIVKVNIKSKITRIETTIVA